MTTYITHKRARFDFDILETFEAGVSLLGTEVKSIRNSQGKLEGSHVVVRGGEAFLVGASIPAYQKANAPKEYDAERARKLLLSAKEIAEISQKTEREGLTAVPLKWYNKNRKLKLEIAIARGKKKADKRQSIKERDTKRDLERELKYK
jgi:SsrA-binding protein